MNINEILKSDYDLLCKDYKKATKKIEKQEQEIERLIISLQAQEELTMNEHIKVERLNNIINEIEKELNKIVALGTITQKQVCLNMLDKLKELKGSDKE